MKYCTGDVESCGVRTALYNIFHEEVASIATMRGLCNLLLIDEVEHEEQRRRMLMMKDQLEALDERIRKRLHELQDIV